jgi:hypothetical protein
MAQYAQIKNGIVVNVIEADQSFINLLPNSSEFLLSSKEGRGTSAGIGYKVLDGKFQPPSPFTSWTFNTTGWEWVAPKARPQDGKPYSWDEKSLTWKEVTV